MEMSANFIGQVIEAYNERTGDYWDTADEYGEPGYGSVGTKLVVLGNYWCRCDKPTRTGRTGLHSFEDHHPRLWTAMVASGAEFEWSDEWITIDSKAYRTVADSYSWQPSAIYHQDAPNDFLTPDDDLATWTDCMANDSSFCIPRSVFDREALEAAGWTCETDRLENGWFPGQTDNPSDVARSCPEGHDYVFVLDGVGQFDTRFSMWVRPQETP